MAFQYCKQEITFYDIQSIIILVTATRNIHYFTD